MFKLKNVGSGLVTGAADTDPCAVATYTQAGAQFGYKFLWTALLTWPILVVLQEMCVRISIVNRKGVMAVLKENYHPWLVNLTSFFLLLVNMINIAADLAAMSECANLLFKINIYVYLIFFALLIVVLEFFFTYRKYSKILIILSFFMFSYIITIFIVQVDWTQALNKTFIPNFEIKREFILNFIAILGATISPYMFFWQPVQELEEVKLKSKNKIVIHNQKKEIRKNKWVTIFGMFMTSLVMFSVILTAAAVLNVNGIENIMTADQAAKVLEPLAGKFAASFFSIGIIGLGLLSVPVLATSAAFVACNALNIKCGLEKKIQKAWGFYAFILGTMLAGVLLSFLPVKPFKLLFYSAAISGILAPFLIAILTILASNKKIMGKEINSKISNIILWSTTILLIIAAGLFLFI